MIKPEFWHSIQLAECDALARLLFIAMWNFADDGGVVPASAKRFKMQAFPGDDFSIEQVAGWIEQLIKNGLIARFESDGESFLRILGWHHQKIQKPTFQYPRSKEFYQAAQERRKRFENRLPGDDDDQEEEPNSSSDKHQGGDESATSTHQVSDSSRPNRSEEKRSKGKRESTTAPPEPSSDLLDQAKLGPYDTPECREALLRWATYLVSVKHRPTHKFTVEELCRLHAQQRWPPERFCKAISFSIAKGLSSVGEPFDKQSPELPTAPPKAPPQRISDD